MEKGLQIKIYDDLYDIWYEPFWHAWWFKVIFWGLILFFIAGVMIWFVKFRKKPKPQLLPWQKALKKLQQLNVESYEGEEFRKVFYYELIKILKNYLSSRYTISLKDKTDTEVIEEIKKTGFPKKLLPALHDIFQGAIFIKFAQKGVEKHRMRTDLNKSIDIIESTKTEQRESKEAKKLNIQ